jgi:cellulose synthase/poly-beta-1,6-N-acetylglucosamine synthase-like glycosyltransferase
LSVISLICLLIVSTQFIYLILFFIGISKKENEPVKPPHAVSVIVCAHDEEENLRELIPILLSQDHPEFEVIIVEDRSNDGTFDYLQKATAENNRLRMVRVMHKPEHINGKKFALTLGIKAAKYDWLLFTDADCRPASTEWIKRMTEQYTDKTQIVLGHSPYEKRKGFLNAFIRFESLLTAIQFIGLAKLGRPYMGVGRNLAYAKSIFFQSKGFNTHLDVTGGDDDLFVNTHAKKWNTKVSMRADAITISKPKENWPDFLHQKLRHLSVGTRYRFWDQIILGLFSITWLATWLLVLPYSLLYGFGLFIPFVFLVRWILIAMLFNSSSRKLGGHFEPIKTPILDFIFTFYYLVTGLRALVVKRIRWKN